MASAIVHGAIEAGLYEPDAVVVADPSEQKRSAFALGVPTAAEALNLLGDGGAVLLAVKPQVLPAISEELRGRDEPVRCVLSILAGVKAAGVRTALGDWARVVRVMPNTPSAVGKGMSAIATSEHAGFQSLAERVFSAIGEVVVLDESLIDAFTALAGSGPAYVFLLAEAMRDAGVTLGMSHEDAELAARQTIVGAAALLEQSGEDAGELRRRVTSPKGTTAAAIDAFQAGGFEVLVERAMTAARDRGRELGG